MITSVNNEYIKEIKKLQQKKYRDEKGLFLVEGEHLVLEAQKTNNLVEIISTEELENAKIVSKEVMATLSSLKTPPKMIGICKKIYSSVNYGNRVAFLDNVQDPGNIGTIIRSATAFNIDTIILRNCADIYNEKIIRATQGMIFQKNIVEVSDINILESLKKDYKIYGTRLKDATELKSVYNEKKFVIILGNEGSGVSSEVLEYCTDFIYINMNPECESLNVAVAASIIFYELDSRC